MQSKKLPHCTSKYLPCPLYGAGLSHYVGPMNLWASQIVRDLLHGAGTVEVPPLPLHMLNIYYKTSTLFCWACIEWKLFESFLKTRKYTFNLCYMHSYNSSTSGELLMLGNLDPCCYLSFELTKLLNYANFQFRNN